MPSTRRNVARTEEQKAWQEREQQAPVDTSEVGVSATDQKSDSGASSARRNLRKASDRQANELESVAPGQRPPRKSTRKSANRTKAATPKTSQVKARVHSPSRRAGR